MTRHPSVSVIIPAYGRTELTCSCVDAVRRTCDASIVVVDNDGRAFPCDAYNYLENEANLGFATACNQGALLARTDLLVFLNNDTEVTDGWLEPLLDAIEDGIAGARLIYPDGTPQHTGVRLFRDARGVITGENLKHEHESGQVDAVTGACLAVSRQTFARCGLFDTGYWNGYEDVDLCLTARSLGIPIRYVAESTVVHHESASGPARWSKVRENIQRLQDRWDPTFDELMGVRR